LEITNIPVATDGEIKIEINFGCGAMERILKREPVNTSQIDI
jgi:hypothetical protein